VAASRALSILSLHNFALLAAQPFGHGAPVNSAHFLPDGAQIVTACDDGAARFWDAATGHLLRVITNATGLTWAGYAAGGTRVVLVTRDEVARVYDAANLGLVFEIPRLRSGSIPPWTRVEHWFMRPNTTIPSHWDLRPASA
jgi:WD40 repeat protein